MIQFSSAPGTEKIFKVNCKLSCDLHFMDATLHLRSEETALQTHISRHARLAKTEGRKMGEMTPSASVVFSEQNVLLYSESVN